MQWEGTYLKVFSSLGFGCEDTSQETFEGPPKVNEHLEMANTETWACLGETLNGFESAHWLY